MSIYNLFISHSWSYSSQYDGLVRLLNADPYFHYKNYSVPKDDPIYNAHSDWQLKNAIRRQMEPTSCVLFVSGVYSSYSKWMQIEVELAQEMKKKIIAVEPYGAQRTSLIVKNAADEIVGWNTTSIIRAIREY